MDGVKVRFVGNWMGNPINSTKVLNRQIATNLLNRKIVEIIIDKEEIIKQDKKSIDSPEFNKMMNSPDVKKGGRPKKK